MAIQPLREAPQEKLTRSKQAEKNQALKEEFSSLSSALEEAEAKKQEIEKETTDIAELKDIKKTLTSEVTKKNARIKELDGVIGEKEGFLASLKQAEAELALLESEIAAKRTSLEEISSHQVSAKSELDALQATLLSVKTEHESFIKSKALEASQSEQELADVRNKLAQTQKEYAQVTGAVETGKKELSKMSDEVTQLHQQKINLTQDMAQLIDERNRQITEFDKKLGEKKELLARDLEEKKLKFEIEYEQKSGELSLRERQVELVTQKLQAAKSKLEVVNGRSFNDIII